MYTYVYIYIDVYTCIYMCRCLYTYRCCDRGRDGAAAVLLDGGPGGGGGDGVLHLNKNKGKVVRLPTRVTSPHQYRAVYMYINTILYIQIYSIIYLCICMYKYNGVFFLNKNKGMVLSSPTRVTSPHQYRAVYMYIYTFV